MTTLVTPRLHLRPFHDGDLPRLVEALADWAVSQWLASPPYPYGDEDGLVWIATVDEDHAAGQARLFAVAERESDRLLGSASLIGDGPEPEFGYWFHPEDWGRGLATEAGAALVTYAGRDLGLARLSARTDPDNLASQRVLTKLGFESTGKQATETPSRRGAIWAACFELRIDRGSAGRKAKTPGD